MEKNVMTNGREMKGNKTWLRGEIILLGLAGISKKQTAD
jgi:hypothetical protein